MRHSHFNTASYTLIGSQPSSCAYHDTGILALLDASRPTLVALPGVIHFIQISIRILLAMGKEEQRQVSKGRAVAAHTDP